MYQKTRLYWVIELEIINLTNFLTKISKKFQNQL